MLIFDDQYKSGRPTFGRSDLLREAETQFSSLVAIRSGTMRSVVLSVVGLLVCLLITNNDSVCQAEVPPGFVIQEVAQIDDATSISPVPSPLTGQQRLLATSKGGQLYMVTVIENVTSDIDMESVVVEEIADFSSQVCTTGERGLLNAIVHPDFGNGKPYIYVFMTFKADTNCEENPISGPGCICMRYGYQNGMLDSSTELVLFRTPRMVRRVHNGGNMAFGKDGYLYVSVGDGGGRREGISQQQYNILGTILRLDEDGNVPSDNPFASAGVRCHETGSAPQQGQVCSEIFAYGLRNPFKISMDPNADDVRFWIGDVGHNTWEEINECGSGYAGVNYGYPLKEGPCADFIGGDFENVADCFPVEGLQEPEHWYKHSPDAGTCVVGSAFSNKGLWPEEYDHIYFGDYSTNKIFLLKPDASAGCSDCPLPLPNYTNETFHTFTKNIVDVRFVPFRDNQALYYLMRVDTSSLQRVVHIGGDNIAPVAAIQTDVTTPVPAGSTIQFDGSLSFDGNGDPLTYLWDFGDGTSATGEVVTHQYNQVGLYVATLTVSDGTAESLRAIEEILIGTPPTTEMLDPAPGTKFAVGDVFVLNGRAFNGNGDPLPDSALTWEARQIHADHFHPFLSPSVGNNIELLPAFEPEDFLAATNSHLQILLTATDENGLETTVTYDIMPKTYLLDFESEPSGQNLLVDGYGVTTPVSVISWENYRVEISAPNSKLGRYVFVGWSDGGDQTHTAVVGTELTGTMTASFRDVCANESYVFDAVCQMIFLGFEVMSFFINSSVSPGGFFGK